MTIKIDEDDDGIEYHLYSKRPINHLGFISYDNDWKKWTFSPDECTYYDAKCLLDIVDWLKDIENGKLGVK